MVVHDLREEVAIENAVDGIGLREVHHEKVAVVVVPGVLVVQPGMPPVERRLGSGFRMYQFETSSIPSGLTRQKITIVSFRKRIVSGSLRLTI